MPFKSEAQRRKIHELEEQGKLPKGTAEKWEAETPEHAKLPDRVHPKSPALPKKNPWMPKGSR